MSSELEVTELRLCRGCEESLPLNRFAFVKRYARLSYRCKACETKKRDEWRRSNPDRQREISRRSYLKNLEHNRSRAKKWRADNAERCLDWHFKATFDISVEEFRLLERKQGGLCAVCRCVETVVDKRTGKPRRLHVDHCHKTGVVRGLLCTRCNMAAGYVRDDPETARRLATYLENTKSLFT